MPEGTVAGPFGELIGTLIYWEILLMSGIFSAYTVSSIRHWQEHIIPDLKKILDEWRNS